MAPEIVADMLQPTDEQVFLVREMHVERRPPDAGTTAHGLHRDPIPPVLEDERYERFVELLSRVSNASIDVALRAYHHGTLPRFTATLWGSRSADAAR